MNKRIIELVLLATAVSYGCISKRDAPVPAGAQAVHQSEAAPPAARTMPHPARVPMLAPMARTDSEEAEENDEEAREKKEAEWSRERDRWMQMRRGDLNGEAPLDGVARAREHIDQMGGFVPRDAGIAPSWTWLGPGNIGGRVRSIIINPTNPNQMMVGGATGGLWRTLDNGQTWAHVNDFLATLSVGCMLLDPNDSGRIYVGTGESFVGWSGNGIFRTLDAWNPGGAVFTQMPGSNNNNFRFVNRLAHHPTNSGHLFAGTSTGLFVSQDFGFSWNPVNTWPGGAITDLKIRTRNAANPNVFDVFVGMPNGARLSTDGALTFVNIPIGGANQQPGRCEVSFAPSNSAILYVSADVQTNNPNPPGGTTATQGEIWRSTNTGAAWARRNTGALFLGGQGGYDNAIWVSPANSSHIVVGGIDLWRSTDGGATLTRISDWTRYPNPGDSAHADQHVIVNHPGYNGTTNNRVLVGNDGGVFRADDILSVGASGWTSLNHGLGVTQFYAGAGVGLTDFSFRIIGGTQDNRTLRLLAGGGTESWYQHTTGDGGYCAVDFTDPNIMYDESQWMQITKSTNGGDSYSLEVDGLGDAINNQNPANNKASNFIAPFTMDPNNAQALVAGGTSIWRTSDGADNWSRIRNPTASGQPCSAVAVAWTDSNIIYVGYNDGEVARSRANNNPNAWDRIDRFRLPAGRVINSIHVRRNDANVIYVAQSGFNADNLWRGDLRYVSATNSWVADWTQITGAAPNDLPSLPVYSVTSHPEQPDWLYVGTELGVFASEDAGQSWSRTAAFAANEGPANVIVNDLFWLYGVAGGFPSRLIAATHGRGMFRTAPLETVFIDWTNVGLEFGTALFPFNTAGEGFGAAGNGSRMVFRAGNYNQTMRVTKRIRNINASGGTVRIGRS